MTDDLVERVGEAISEARTGNSLSWRHYIAEAQAAIAAIDIPGQREAAARAALEAAAAYVDGKGGAVIPGATVFAALVSGNFQPCMSGDARDRLPVHIRRRFDAATDTLAHEIRAIDPAAFRGGDDATG